jgi:hypothetical protein
MKSLFLLLKAMGSSDSKIDSKIKSNRPSILGAQGRRSYFYMWKEKGGGPVEWFQQRSRPQDEPFRTAPSEGLGREPGKCVCPMSCLVCLQCRMYKGHCGRQVCKGCLVTTWVPVKGEGCFMWHILRLLSQKYKNGSASGSIRPRTLWGEVEME